MFLSVFLFVFVVFFGFYVFFKVFRWFLRRFRRKSSFRVRSSYGYDRSWWYRWGFR